MAIAGIALPMIALISVAAWAMLLEWFDLRDKIDVRYFAFEKVPGQFDSTIMRGTLGVFLGVSLLYIAGAILLAATPTVTHSIKFGALLCMAGPALINVFLYPAGALDVFNYMVDLKLAFHFHDNPYVVTNPAFLKGDPFVGSAFLLNVPLFYGPAWLLFSGLPGVFTGYQSVLDVLVGLKLLNLTLLAGTGWMIVRLQRTPRRRWLAAFLFLANPLVLFEGIGNAHNDVMMGFFLVLAIFLLRQRRFSAGAAPGLALSVLVKLFTAVLTPLFVLEALRSRWPVRRIAVAAGLTVVVALAVIAPFWDGGDLWTGIREGTRLGQRMDHVSPLSLAQQHLKNEYIQEWPYRRYMRPYASSDVLPQAMQDHLHRQFLIGFIVLAAAVLGLRLVRWISFERAAALTLIFFSLTMTNLYPWYLIPIIALLALDLEALGIAFVFAASLLGLAYYPAYVWAHFNTEKPLYDVHIFLAIFLTAPMIAFLVVEVVRILRVGWRSRRGPAIAPVPESG